MESVNFVEQRLKVYGNKLFIPVFLFGFISLTAQVIYLHQIQAIFGNTEYIISIFWVVWLTASSFGWSFLKLLQISLSCLVSIWSSLLVIIFFIFRLFEFLSTTGLSSELIVLIGSSSFFLLSVFSFLSGVSLRKIFERLKTEYDHSTRKILIKLYLWETGGFVAAGLLSIITVNFLSEIFFIFISSFLASQLSLIFEKNKNLWKNFLKIGTIISLFGIFIYNSFEHTLFKKFLPGYTLIKTVKTLNGRTEVLKTQSKEIFLRINSRLLPLKAEPGEDEELFCPAYSTIKNPQSILIYGSSFPLFLPAITKSDIKRKDVLIQDKILLKTMLKYSLFPFNFHISSLHRFAKKNIKNYDIIFLNFTIPGRLDECGLLSKNSILNFFKLLKDDGTLQISIPNEGDSFSTVKTKMLSGIKKSLSSVFSSVEFIPLNNYILFLASNTKKVISIDTIFTELKKKNFHPLYFSKYSSGYRFTLKKDLVEYSFFNNPISFLGEGISLTISRFNLKAGLRYSNLINRIRNYKNLVTIIIVILIISISLFLSFIFHSNSYSLIFFSGAGHLALQTSFIFHYQANIGGLTHDVGLLIALFMTGLICGIIIPDKLKRKENLILLFFIVCSANLLCSVVLFPFICYLLFIYLTGLSQGFVFCFATQNIKTPLIYSFEMLGAGLGGILFPLILMPSLSFFMYSFIIFISLAFSLFIAKC